MSNTRRATPIFVIAVRIAERDIDDKRALRRLRMALKALKRHGLIAVDIHEIDSQTTTTGANTHDENGRRKLGTGA
jgi:hypothetical protein